MRRIGVVCRFLVAFMVCSMQKGEKDVGTGFADVSPDVANPAEAFGMGLGRVGADGETDAAHWRSGGGEKPGLAAGCVHGQSRRQHDG